jgi:hypothetical protein
MSMLLQVSNACSTSEWANGEWFRCAFEPAVQSVGEPTVGMLLGGTLVLAFYLAGGGIAAPAVLTLLLAAAVVPLLPAGLIGIAAGIAFVGIVGALVAVGQRYVLPGGAIR